ncbi:MAG: hypothetical protein ACK4MG_04110 [Aquabacterium sp.]
MIETTHAALGYQIRLRRFDNLLDAMTASAPDTINAMLADSYTMQACTALSHKGKVKDGRSTRQYTLTRHDWLGAPDLTVLEQRIREGWPEGAAMIAGLAASELPDPVSIKRRREWADQGDELDIHRVYAGKLDSAWSRMGKRESRAPRRITLMCDLSCPWFQKADALAWRGVAALKLSDALEEAGYQVQILAVNCAVGVDSQEEQPGHEAVAAIVPVKHYDAPLDLSSLASVLVAPGFKRRYLHRWHFASEDRPQSRSLGGHGEILADWLHQLVISDLGEPVLRIDANVLSKATCQKAIDSGLLTVRVLSRLDMLAAA